MSGRSKKRDGRRAGKGLDEGVGGDAHRLGGDGVHNRQVAIQGGLGF